MKTQSLIVFVLALLMSLTGFGQPPQVSVLLPEHASNDIYRTCLTGEFGTLPPSAYPDLQDIYGGIINGNYDLVINKDCPPNYNIPYTIVNPGRCRLSGWGLGYSYYTTAKITLDGKHVANVSVPGNAMSSMGSVNLSTITFLDNLDSPGIYSLKIEECRTTTYTGGPGSSSSVSCNTLATINILVLGNGDQFYQETTLATNSIPDCDNPPSMFQGLGICDFADDNADPGSTTITVSFSDVRKEGNNIQVFGGIKGTASASTPKDWHSIFSFGGSISAGVNWTHNWSQIESTVLNIDHSVTIDPEEGECVWPSIQLNVNSISIQSVTVTCDSLQSVGDNIIIHEVTGFNLIECSATELPDFSCSEGCSPIIDILNNIDGNRRFTDEYISREYNSVTCSFDISVEQCDDAEHMEFYSWVYPDGTVVQGPGISNVPIGIYTLQITDECGGFYELDVNVCPDQTIGEWAYYEDQNLICAPVSCDGTDCGPGYESNECVEPEVSECTYDETTQMICQTISCPEGTACEGEFEAIENCVAALVTEWIYDDFQNLFCRTISCPTDSSCDGCFTPIEECVEGTYGEWTYDDFLDVCERDILINGEASGQTETSEPVVEYSYDDFLDQCIRLTICGGSEGLTIEDTEDPTYGNWNIENDFFSGIICDRQVICFGDVENNSGWENEVNDDPNVEWEYDDFWEDCTGYVFCDGFGDWNEDGELDAEVEYVNWEFGFFDYSECTAEVNCSYDGELYVPEGYPEITVQADEDISLVNNFQWQCLYQSSCGPLNVEVYSGVSIIEVVINGVTSCLIACQEYPDVFITGDCNEIDEFTDGNGNLFLETEEELIAYNQMITSRISGQPLISPNPVADHLNIKYLPLHIGDGFVEIIGMNGQVMSRQSINGELTNLRLDMSQLNSGLFLIRLLDKDNTEVYREKVIKH